MRNMILTLVGSLSVAMTLGSTAHGAIQPVDFARKIVGQYVLTAAKGDCAATLLARGVRGTKDTRVLIEAPQKVPLTMIRYINRGNMYENIDIGNWTVSARRVNTTLKGGLLTMIEQQCAHLSCDTNLQVRVQEGEIHTRILVTTKSVRCEYTK